VRILLRWVVYPAIWLAGVGMMIAALGAVAAALWLYPSLPNLDSLTEHQPKQPLRVYTADGYLLGEFGDQKRIVVKIGAVPAVVKNAILAAEDDRFYKHSGVDILGILRAGVVNIASGGKKQGASTITMQVARNFFLTNEKTFSRKLSEILLALKIESTLSKDEIFELYINHIYLGQRAYGFATASQTYFSKPLASVSLAEAAMLAGLPKGPSLYNPVVNPARATDRQRYVLRRMRELGEITDAQLENARNEKLVIRQTAEPMAVHGEYVAEMARQVVYERFKEDAYTRGYKVVTTILKADQEAAYEALHRAVLNYDKRQGYRGASRYVDLAKTRTDDESELEEILQEEIDSGGTRAAIVLEAGPRKVRAYLRGGELATITGAGLRYAQDMLGKQAPAQGRLRRGALIQVQKSGDQWSITQLPDVEAAFVSARPIDGAVRALVGGFDFNRAKFNRVTQAWRQPGSSFKPFFYSAALERGYTPETIVDDAPIVIPTEEMGGHEWHPKNYEGTYEGKMPLRRALAHSKNVVAVSVLRDIGVKYGRDYITRFGFERSKHPDSLMMALGSGSVTPWQMLAGYSVFANGGYKIEPYVIKQILDSDGKEIVIERPHLAGRGLRFIDGLHGVPAERVISEQNAAQMDSMMRDVITNGTATKALTLNRHDIAGKTGTTNDYVDAWFCGYQRNLVAVSWLGYDKPESLGHGETGGVAALPIWIDYMRVALQRIPEAGSASERTAAAAPPSSGKAPVLAQTKAGQVSTARKPG
jgi:penicillin-binding protein 1A